MLTIIDYIKNGVDCMDMSILMEINNNANSFKDAASIAVLKIGIDSVKVNGENITDILNQNVKAMENDDEPYLGKNIDVNI